MRWYLRSKIHKATVTEADVNYIGSITIDEDLVEKVMNRLRQRRFWLTNRTGLFVISDWV